MLGAVCTTTVYFFIFSGYGLFTKEEFKQGEFVLHYDGQLLLEEPSVGIENNYLYEVSHSGRKFW